MDDPNEVKCWTGTGYRGTSMRYTPESECCAWGLPIEIIWQSSRPRKMCTVSKRAKRKGT